VHTLGHTQWFYFAVSNTHSAATVAMDAIGLSAPVVRVKFNVVNLTKPDSLFNLGMQPVLYSRRDAGLRGVGWVRAGTDVAYFSNQYPRRSTAGEGESSYFTLTFTMDFANAGDTYLIAYTYPYTYSDYRRHIDGILAVPGSDAVIRRSKLCKTLAGYDCDLLVITNFEAKRPELIGPLTTPAAASQPRRSKGEVRATKPGLVFSARVHPGETQASWMMQGMLDFLVSSAPAARFLREAFVVFVVPMLNIDGVVLGNSRVGLAGVDLNRMWRSPTPQHPSILALKTFMLAQRKVRELGMFVDLHGHTRKHNVFMYGCGVGKRHSLPAQAFPKFLSLHKIGSKFFSFADCSFHIKKSRESTARVVVCKEVGILRSYTLEATFAGPNFGDLKNHHMGIRHLMEVGTSLCESVAEFALTPAFSKDFSIPVEAMSIVVPLELQVTAEDLVSERDEVDNDDVSSGSDEDQDESASQIKSSDSLDNFMMQLSIKGPSSGSTAKTTSTSASKDCGQGGLVSESTRRPKETLRLLAGKNAMSVVAKKKGRAGKRNSISGGQQIQAASTAASKLDLLMTPSYAAYAKDVKKK
jgi:hypothetical protein